MQENRKHIHIIGICGVATSALAIALKDKGYKVTGSDKGFYPPVSTELEKNGIDFYAGWHPEKIGMPDFIVAGGGGTSTSNPEIIYAKEKNIPLLSFAEAVGNYIVKENSIVTVGTWGKTTTSSLLSFILIEAGMNPSYFTGGISLSHKTAAITDSTWSVVEGDEYQISITDKRPKFACYAPKHLILTSVSWDHADLYPTEDSYFDTFTKLISSIPNEGKLVACTDNNGVQKVLKDSSKKIISYGQNDIENKKTDFKYHSIKHSKEGLSFTLDHAGKSYTINSPILGRFNVENIAGCFAMAFSIGIDADAIIRSIQNFKGIKRRLEKRFEKDVTIFDCHAPTPEKAASVLESLREIYTSKIIAVYEPNIGGRQRNSSAMYANAFKDVDTVIIPRLTKLKTTEDEKLEERPLEGLELSKLISQTHSNTLYIEDDKELVAKIIEITKKGDVIAFLGSHGFRGMIEEIITSLRQQYL